MEFLLYLGWFAMFTYAVSDDCRGIRHRYYWRDYDGRIPSDAYNITKNLYIAQVVFDSVLIGGYYAGTGVVITEYGGRRVDVRNTIKFLCSTERDHLKWTYTNTSSLLPDTLDDVVIGGFEEETVTYIGRIFDEEQWKIGKIFPPSHSLEGLHVWKNNGEEYISDEFEVLRFLNECNENNVM